MFNLSTPGPQHMTNDLRPLATPPRSHHRTSGHRTWRVGRVWSALKGSRHERYRYRNVDVNVPSVK